MTHHAQLGTKTFALTPAQACLLTEARQHRDGLFVRRQQVRSARVLAGLGFGTLEDHGRTRFGDYSDGERWIFTLSELARKETP